MTSWLRLHIALSRYLNPSLSDTAPGCHKSMCNIQNGAVTGHEKSNSELNLLMPPVLIQWAHAFTQAMMIFCIDGHHHAVESALFLSWGCFRKNVM